MRLHVLLGSFALIALTGCGQSADPQASSAQGNVLPAPTPADTDNAARTEAAGPAPSRALTPELPGDDPTFRAAIDAFDREVLEARTIAVSGLVSNDLGGGYFGQRFSMSLWTPVTPDVAMSVCHELVAYANELDFPATELSVTQKSYADFEWSQELVAVDSTGFCVQTGT